MHSASTPDSIDAASASPHAGRIISGFWRRLIAFFLDSIILGFAGFISGLLLFNFYAHLGGWGRLLGFFIALIYFGFLNSSLGQGQTLGKRIMKIEVVNGSGDSIPLGRSLLRFTILGIPFFLNGAPVPPDLARSPVGYGIAFIVFGLGGAIIYLYIFNRHTRQSLHDLIAGTFVTKTLPKGALPDVSVWKTHFAVVGVWFLSLIGLTLFMHNLSQKGIFPELLAFQKSIYASGKFNSATAVVGKTWKNVGGEKRESTFFMSQVTLKENLSDYEAAAREVASLILNEYPEVRKKDFLSIGVSYGYDIGIARAWQSQNFRHSPKQWQEILNKQGQK
jgi:uncharacterized RDD family membrane protein YckC